MVGTKINVFKDLAVVLVKTARDFAAGIMEMANPCSNDVYPSFTWAKFHLGDSGQQVPECLSDVYEKLIISIFRAKRVSNTYLTKKKGCVFACVCVCVCVCVYPF